MKHSTILDILKNIDISNKYKHYDKDNNKINVESLINYFWFRKIFEMKYLELFLYYYNDEQPLKELILFDKKVILSEKTKSFYDLLQKKEQLKERIIYFCKLIKWVQQSGPIASEIGTEEPFGVSASISDAIFWKAKI